MVDQNPGTVPAAIVNTSSSSLSVNKGDGVWYLHVRARGANGWSSTSHFRIQIDTSPPANLIITSDPKKDADRRPMISFNATDAVSGIAGYQLAIDKSEFKPVSSPYIPSTITSGNHTFTVLAFDKAGNMTEGKYNLYIKEVPKPVVTSPADGAMIKIGEKVTISGTGASGTLINIYFDGLKINKEEIKVDENGRWSFTYDALILPGKHNIVVVAVRDGIESQQSDQVNLRVDPSAVDVFGFIIPSYFVFIGLIFISLILLSLLILTYIYLRRKFIALVKRIKKEEEEIKSDIQSEYASMERELRKEVDTRKGNGISDEAGGQLESSIDEDVYDSAKRLIGKVNEKEANLPEEKNPLEAAREKVIDILKKPEDKE